MNVGATKTKFVRFFSDARLPTPSTGPETYGQADRWSVVGVTDRRTTGSAAGVYAAAEALHVGGRLERASACVDRVTCALRANACVCVCVGVREYRSVRRRRRRRR